LQCICRLQCMTSLWCAAYSPGERQLILTLKVETRHPVGGPFGCAFSGICNHCGVMTAWNRKIWIFLAIFALFFWKKRPFMVQFSNSVTKVYMATPIDVVVFKCREICPTGNRWDRALFTSPKRISAPSQTVATARIAPKIYQGQPPSTFGSQCSKFHPNRFTLVLMLVLRTWMICLLC